MERSRVERELLKLEERYWQAIQDRDVDAALRLTDDTCIVAGAQGVASIDRQGFINMMNAPNYILNKFKLKDPEVRLLGDDIAILAYKVHEDLTVEGKDLVVDAADASMWVRRDGRWVCAMHTESILGDPFGRDRVN